MDTGKKKRFDILTRDAELKILSPLRTHGWKCDEPEQVADGEYIILRATKGEAKHTVALMYTSGTKNAVYKRLDGQVERIFINGQLDKLEPFAYGTSTPVEPVDDFHPLLTEWNKELDPGPQDLPTPPRQRPVRHITAENPLQALWARIDQLKSIRVAQKLIAKRAQSEGYSVLEDNVRTKAEGLAFCIRNASEFFQSSAAEPLNKRIVSLYYGALALAEAEMLAMPKGPASLDDVESMTKFGHGLYTIPGENDGFVDIHVGVLATGFFAEWTARMGYDTSAFPRQKAKKPTDLEKLPAVTHCTVEALLSAIPELGELFLAVFDGPPSWVVPVYNQDANQGFSLYETRRRSSSSYIRLLDESGRVSVDRIASAGWPLAEITEDAVQDDDGAKKAFKARVEHPNTEYWWGSLPIHHSPYEERGSLIVPVIGGVSDYRAVALVTLYALSILVRYMPSVWRKVDGGDWDQFQVVIRTVVEVFERVLPQEFLESITDEHIHLRPPGAFL